MRWSVIISGVLTYRLRPGPDTPASTQVITHTHKDMRLDSEMAAEVSPASHPLAPTEEARHVWDGVA